MALLPDEPMGMVATRTAGAVEVHASFSWRSATGMPDTPVLSEGFLPRARLRATESDDPGTASRHLVAQVRALTGADLGCAVERVLRAATEYATLADAVFEASAVRVAGPQVTPPDVLQDLARDLWAAGFRVSFGPCWSPAPEASAYVGCGDPDGSLAAFLRSHPSWRTL